MDEEFEQVENFEKVTVSDVKSTISNQKQSPKPSTIKNPKLSPNLTKIQNSSKHDQKLDNQIPVKNESSTSDPSDSLFFPIIMICAIILFVTQLLWTLEYLPTLADLFSKELSEEETIKLLIDRFHQNNK
uniref:Uncharacterized protein n=1 Tax=Panagrolaimus sp. JU765 TaxID=591449 RepID=A0AC34PYX0_9BILA